MCAFGAGRVGIAARRIAMQDNAFVSTPARPGRAPVPDGAGGKGPGRFCDGERFPGAEGGAGSSVSVRKPGRDCSATGCLTPGGV